MSDLGSSRATYTCPFTEKCIVSGKNNCLDSQKIYQIVCNKCEFDLNSGPAISLRGASQPEIGQTNTAQPDIEMLSSFQKKQETKLQEAKCQYIGTTYRSQHARSLEHQLALDKKDTKNALAKHMAIDHPNQEHDFSMLSVTGHKFNLHRQILEGIYINQATENKSSKLLNSKSEWGRAKMFRLRVENSQGT